MDDLKNTLIWEAAADTLIEDGRRGSYSLEELDTKNKLKRMRQRAQT